MSKNVRIIQNGNEKTLRKVEKIQTYLANGNICNWVPEDEYPLGILTVTGDGVFNPADDPNGPYYGYSQVHASGVGSTDFGSLAVITITKNGEYIASGESSGPYYGYSKVIVNVEKSDGGGSPVVGKDDDGDDAVPKIDDDGHIVTEKLPTRISINVYPNNLVYEDGQAIDFTGLRVKAFLPNDTEWGIVDDNELIKPVTVAEGDGGGDTGGNDTVTSDIDIGGISKPFPFSTGGAQGYSITGKAYAKISAPYVSIYQTGSYDCTYCMATSEPGQEASIEESTESGSIRNYIIELSSSFTYDGKTVYYSTTTPGTTGHYTRGIGSLSPSPMSGSSPNYGAIAWTMVYGEAHYGGSQQTIPLQWKRPGDGKVLETSFTIAVHGSPGGDNNASGGNVTPGGT